MSVINILEISSALLLLSLFQFLFLHKKNKVAVKRIDKLIMALGALVLTLLSLLVVVKKVGGTIMQTVHGWPHFYLTHHIKNVVDGALILKWNFISGSLFIYPLSNFIFYLSIILFFYLIIRLFIKSEKKTTILLLIVIVTLSTLLISSQKIKELYIKQEIKQANYCQIDSDCKDAGGSCPFNCYSYVNKSEVNRISDLINSYYSTCVYQCISCPTAKCENNKCQPVCTDLPEEKEDSAEISEIFNKIKYPEQWNKYSYSSLTSNDKFSSEKLNRIIPELNDENSIFLQTDFSDYDVYLMVFIEEINENELKESAFNNVDTNPDIKYIIQSQNIKISDGHCTGIWDCYHVSANNKEYVMIFEIVSDQKPPADLDYAGWIPDHNITELDILNILESFAAPQSITEELATKFKSVVRNADVRAQESFLWWNDDDGYSILVPGTESIIASMGNEAGSMEFPTVLKNNFSRDLVKIAGQALTERGFILNERNSSANESDKRFYDYVQAYEKGKDLCVIKVNPDYSSYGCGEDMFMCRTVEVICGNDLIGSHAEQLPFLEALDLRDKETVATAFSQEGSFFQINMHGRRAGSTAILKKERDGYRVLFIGQEGPPCDLMDEEKIPASVLSTIGRGGCWTNTGYRSADD